MMPPLNVSLHGTPNLVTSLSPGAASPVVPIDGLPTLAFSSVIASVGGGSAAAAPAIPKQSAGTALPPDRRDIAGDSQLRSPPLDVETVMIGSGGIGSAFPDAQAEAPEQPPLDAGLRPTIDGTGMQSGATPAVDDPGPVACGLQGFALGGASKLTLARVNIRSLPGPLRLPPEKVLDMPEPNATLLEHGPDKTHSDPMPAVLVEEPAAAQPLPFAPVVNAPLPLSPSKVETDASNAAPAICADPAPSAPQSILTAGSEPHLPQPASSPGVQAAAQLPQSFALSADVVRHVAQMVQTALGEPVDGARAATPADAAMPADPAALQPLPVAQPASPLHAAFVSAPRPIIDTGRAEWMQSMIDKIAEMPQTDNRREAQIRLIPDALGPVSVKIEQHDERMHVTLHAESAQTRQLLSDAAPRLQEIAEARGIRLTQSAVGGGESHDRRPPSGHQPATPLRPRSAKTEASAESESSGDLIA